MLFNKNGFSLIELSIVLIIIGLLVAGVTGGKSLIDSARYRAFINELEDYKKAFYIYRALNGDFPGQENAIDKCPFSNPEHGCVGLPAFIYPEDSDSPYRGMAISPNNYGFIDLYLAKIMDFNSNIGMVSPKSKIYKNFVYHTFYKFYGGEEFVGDFSNNIRIGETYLVVRASDIADQKIAKRVFKYVDEKTDDGIYNNGNVRSFCTSTGKTAGYASYTEAIDDPDGYCSSLFYKFN